MFSLTILSSSRSCAIWSSTGAIAWHGPHHSAQKSTSTGLSLWSTSWSKVCSVTVSGMKVLSTSSVCCLKRGGESRCSRSLRSADAQAASERARPPRAGAGGAGALGGGADVPAPARAECRRAALQLHRRADHRQQPDGRPSRLGPPPKDVFQRYYAAKGHDERYQTASTARASG